MILPVFKFNLKITIGILLCTSISLHAATHVDYLRYLPEATSSSDKKWNREVTKIYKDQKSIEEVHSILKQSLKTPDKNIHSHIAAALLSPNLAEDRELMQLTMDNIKTLEAKGRNYDALSVLKHRLIDDSQFRNTVVSSKELTGSESLKKMIKETDAPARLQQALTAGDRPPASVIAEALLSKEPEMVDQAISYTQRTLNKKNLPSQDLKILDSLRSLATNGNSEKQLISTQLLLSMIKYPLSPQDAQLIEKVILTHIKDPSKRRYLEDIIYMFPNENLSSALQDAFAESLKNKEYTNAIGDKLFALKTDNETLKKEALETMKKASPDVRRQLSTFLLNNSKSQSELKSYELMFRQYPELRANPVKDAQEAQLFIDLRNMSVMNDNLKNSTSAEVDYFAKDAPKAKMQLKNAGEKRNEIAASLLKDGTAEEKRYSLALIDNQNHTKISPKLLESIKPLLSDADLTVRIQAAMLILDKNLPLTPSENQEISKTFSQALRSKEISITTHERFLSKVPADYFKNQFTHTSLAESLKWLQETGVHVVLQKLTEANVTPSGPLHNQLFSMIELDQIPAYLTKKKQEEIIKLLSKGGLDESQVLRLLAIADRRPEILEAVTEVLSSANIQNKMISDKVIQLCLKHGFNKCSGNTSNLITAMQSLNTGSSKQMEIYQEMVKDFESEVARAKPFDKNNLKSMAASVLKMGAEMKLPLSDKGQTAVVKLLLDNYSLRETDWKTDELAEVIKRFGAKEVAEINPVQASKAGMDILGLTDLTSEKLREPYWQLYKESANMSDDPVGVMEVLYKQAKFQRSKKMPKGNTWVIAKTSLDLLDKGHNPKKTIEKSLINLQSISGEELKTNFGNDSTLVSSIQKAQPSVVPSNSKSTSYCTGDIINLFKKIK